MTSSVPRVRRVVLIVLLSDEGHVFLWQPDGGPLWWPIRLEVPASGSYLSVLDRWQREFPLPGMRRGRVTGRLAVASAVAGEVARVEYRLFIFKVAGPVADIELFCPTVRWWPLEILRDASGALFPRDLGALMEGYAEGWVPDGPITLEE
ncbi:hypothetical protein AB0H73_09655 [Streptomyces olivoreticuli]